MYNKVDTIIAKARYALSLPTLICTTGLFSPVWCLGRVYPFIHQVAKIFFTEMGGGGGAWGGGGVGAGGGGGGGRERKGTPFLSAKRIRLWTMALVYVFAQPQSV